MAYLGNKGKHFAYLFDRNYKVVSLVSIVEDPVQRAEETLKYLEDKVEVIAVHSDVYCLMHGSSHSRLHWISLA